MNKCEWKGIKAKGQSTEWKFYPCDNFDPGSWGNGKTVGCQSCITDIRKPEPEKQDPNNWSKEKWIAFYHAVKPFMGIDNND